MNQSQSCILLKLKIAFGLLPEPRIIDIYSRGDVDENKYMILLCPNHHSVVHKTDAQFDLSDKSFAFEKLKETVRHNIHF